MRGVLHPIPALARVAAIAAAALTITGSAAAAPTSELEPNDTIFQYTGPVAIDGAVGGMATANDLDVFLIRLRPQRQVKLTYENTNGCAGRSSLNYSLLTPTGTDLEAPNGSSDFYTSSTKAYTITTPGVFGGVSQEYYLRFWADASQAVGCQYRFTVSGAAGEATDAIDATPPLTYPMVETSEPNDLDAQATGPMAADTLYAGTIDTSNDLDLLYVPIKAGTAPTFELQSASGGVDGEIFVRGERYSKTSLSTDYQPLDTETLAVASADTTYLVSISGAVGAKWRLRVTPPLAIGTTPAPPPTVVPPVVTPPQFISRQISISRAGGRYRGRVTGAKSSCTSGVTVTLRRKGKKQSYGSATTRQDGSWTINRSAVRGKAYARVEYEERNGFACGADDSKTIKRK